MPDDAAAVDGLEHVDVGADVAGRVQAVEVLDLQVRHARGSEPELARLAQVDLGGQLAEHGEAALEVVFLALEHHADIGGVRVGVDGGDEDGARGAVRGRHARERAHADRGPQARLEQQRLDVVGAELVRGGAGAVGLELDLILVAVLLEWSVELDDERHEDPLLAAMDRHHGARRGGGEADAGGLAVLEQELAALDPIADGGGHLRLHADVVRAQQGDVADRRSGRDGLLRVASDGQVEPLRDAMCCHETGVLGAAKRVGLRWQA